MSPKPRPSIVDNSGAPWPQPEAAWSPGAFEVAGKPLLAWVVFLSPTLVDPWKRTLAHLTCYASRRGIRLYVEYEPLMDDRLLYFYRQRSVMKHLANHAVRHVNCFRACAVSV